MAGFAFSKEIGASPEECLRVAAAASVANAMERAAGSLNRESYEGFLQAVKIERADR